MLLKNFFKGYKAAVVSEHIIERIKSSMINIPTGSFLMGSAEGEDDESPIHNVLLDEFKLSKFTVSQEEWEEVMENRPWKKTKFSMDKHGYPAVNITWYEVQEFIDRINANCDEKFRLPTETEWEYACRAGTSDTLAYGVKKEHLVDHAWYYDNAFKMEKMTPQPIGKLSPNSWGLYDMQGNVYEWCQDWFRRNYYNKSPLYNPPGPRYGKYKVVRGGDWARTDYFLRVSSRRHYTPHHKDPFIGFRLAMDIKEKKNA